MPRVQIPDLVELLEAADDKYIELFRSIPAVRVVAPGRVNLMGEHTDYNEGFVMPMALPMITVMVSSPKLAEGEGGICCVHTLARDIGDDSVTTVTFNVATVEKKPIQKGEHWCSYVRGVTSLFQQAGGPKLPAFNAVVASSVPIGGGLSSSAALEVATLLTCQKLSEFDVFSLSDCALICQKAEHEWADSPCGLMDQLASLGGVSGHALFIDCRTNKCEPVKTNFKDHVKVVIIDSGVHHSIAAGQYRLRRSECEKVAKYFKVPSLRSLQERLPELEELCQEVTTKLGESPARRLRHILTENQRVLDAVKAMSASDFVKLGELMQESHASLKSDYEISCKEVDELVDISMAVEGVYGARMTGGGFGGSIVVIVKPEAVESLISTVDNRYSGTARMYVVDACFGARILSQNKERTKSISKCLRQT